MTDKFEDMTDKELKKKIKSLHNRVYNRRIFGKSDLFKYSAITEELQKRGYKIKTELKIFK